MVTWGIHMIVYMLSSKQLPLLTFLDFFHRVSVRYLILPSFRGVWELKTPLGWTWHFLSFLWLLCSFYLVSLRVPEVIALPIMGGSLPYLEWIKSSTRDWFSNSSTCWQRNVSISRVAGNLPFSVRADWLFLGLCMCVWHWRCLWYPQNKLTCHLCNVAIKFVSVMV